MEKVFADGFSFKRKENAPEFVVGRLSMKVDEAIGFMKANEKNGWVSIDVKQGRSGNYYCELDQYEPKKQDEAAKPVSKPQAKQIDEEEDDEDLPF
jgi:hypothetical protein